MPELEPIEPLIALLRDIEARRVYTSDDFGVDRDLPTGGQERVTEMAGTLERQGWAYEPAQCRVWELTPEGRERLRGAP